MLHTVTAHTLIDTSLYFGILHSVFCYKFKVHNNNVDIFNECKIGKRFNTVNFKPFFIKNKLHENRPGKTKKICDSRVVAKNHFKNSDPPLLCFNSDTIIIYKG